MVSKKQSLQLLDDTSAADSLNLLKEELKNLKTITETPYRTEGKLDGFDKSISEETKIENLVRMHSSVMGRKVMYDNSQEKLSQILGGSVSVPVFKINGFSPEAIEADIVLKIRILNVTMRKKELEDLVKEGQSFLTEKDKFTLYKQKLEKALGGKA